MEWSTISTQVDHDHPPVFAKAHCLDPEKLEIGKAEFKRLESADIVHHSTSPGCPPCTWFLKKDGLGGLVVITVASI
jgi:hypothetical protein